MVMRMAAMSVALFLGIDHTDGCGPKLQKLEFHDSFKTHSRLHHIAIASVLSGTSSTVYPSAKRSNTEDWDLTSAWMISVETGFASSQPVWIMVGEVIDPWMYVYDPSFCRE